MNVVLTVAARGRFREALKFSRGYMTAREARKVNAEVRKALRYLEGHPVWGATEDLMGGSRYRYRRIIVGHIKIIYRVGRTIIHVTDIFDSRQDPGKMKG
ncbi:MAG: type II toxin-antitoxin system RelE/ParE family toxin [Flavobacteriales bacterium]|nr:type II toxin-antitoxin system RelE/ParE family toxin [Flavobacteriales bacterium]MBK7246607.1 type II toxin-antitoxin system RelE/ParE family toxin [Flavobacteriales bacterium]MBK7287800.1 type II toxin-antitoxin system RelE/ParE family toxin [Flavobacteriales bacterium]MBK9060784.1 type II toxin-antitoxin system RelE/ParE family toxin [Flavobacteriales bacterium]MBK9597643.1 type II toxin-antitoxin system RelE/ParE family toxin [Flavobacteriales bacterium]